MSATRTRLDQHGAVRLLTLDDPEKRNAIGLALAAELVERSAEIAGDPQVRALVVTGAGSAFCAGADLPDVFGPDRPPGEMRSLLQSYYECFLSIRRLPFPTFAAVNGPAIGAGLNLALSCDIRIAGPSAQFGATFARIGLHPGGGCSYFLTKAIGPQRTLKLLLEGGVMDARDAVQTGLALSVEDDPLNAALALAEKAAALEPSLARNIVHAVELAETASFEAVLDFESRAQAESTQNPRFREYVSRFG